jgi:hypothetical protein
LPMERMPRCVVKHIPAYPAMVVPIATDIRLPMPVYRSRRSRRPPRYQARTR